MIYKCKQFENGQQKEIAEFDITEDKENFYFKVLKQPNLTDYTNELCEAVEPMFKDFKIPKTFKKDMQVKTGYVGKTGQLDQWKDKSFTLFHYQLSERFTFTPSL